MTRHRLSRIGGPSVLVIVALALLVVWPAQRAAGTANDREAAARSETDDLVLLHAQLKNLSEQQPALDSKLDSIDHLVPTEQDLAGFLTELDAVAEMAGVELRDVVPSQSPVLTENGIARSVWDITLFSVRVEGDYQSLVNLAEALHHTRRLVVIDQITVGVGLGEALIGDFELQIFHQADPAAEQS